MSRWARRAPALIGLIVAGLWATGCETAATPSPPPASSQKPTGPVAQVATVTHTSTPGPAATQPGLPTTTPTAIPSPVPATATPTPTQSATTSPLPPTATDKPTATATTSPSTTPSPTSPPPTATATPTRRPATATASSYRFLPAGPAQPDPSHRCPTCPKAPAYIVGHVLSAMGNPLPGVRLVCYNEWHRYPVVATKGGGEYDFPIIQAETTWYLVVLNAADQPISPEVAVAFDPKETCRYILDWRRVD